MPTGRVKWFDEVRGYGFIAREDGEDVFVHYPAIVGEGYRGLTEGSAVEFDVEQDPQGPRAVKVVVTRAAPRTESPFIW